MPPLVRLATYESESSPGTWYETVTDGQVLSCNCPAWTRQVHFSDCAQITSGTRCDCRTRINRGLRVTEERTARTCKHLREVRDRVAEAGGIPAAIRLVQGGYTLGNIPTPAPLRDRPAAPPPPVRRTARRGRGLPRGPQVNQHGVGCACPGCLSYRAEREEDALQAARRRFGPWPQNPQPAPPSASALPVRPQTGHRAIRIRDDDDE